MFWNALEKYRDVGLLIVRLGLGIGFFYYHGWDKLLGGPERWEGLGRNAALIGLAFWPTFWGFLLALAESVGALLIAAGFLFRPMCVILAIGMFVAWLSHVVNERGNAGHAFKNFFILTGLLLVGPGKYSIDNWLSSRKTQAAGKQV